VQVHNKNKKGNNHNIDSHLHLANLKLLALENLAIILTARAYNIMIQVQRTKKKSIFSNIEQDETKTNSIFCFQHKNHKLNWINRENITKNQNSSDIDVFLQDWAFFTGLHLIKKNTWQWTYASTNNFAIKLLPIPYGAWACSLVLPCQHIHAFRTITAC